MANSVKLEVITPSKLFYSGKIELVIVKTASGDEGFMANHAWACKLLEVGELWIKEKDSREFKVAALAGGFIDVKDTIIVYSDAAEWQEDIDIERAKQAREEAEDWLSKNDAKKESEDLVRAQIAMAKAITRMKVGQGIKRR